MNALTAPNLNIGLRAGLMELYATVSPSTRREFAMLLGLMLVGAAAELATIGSVIPFLTLLARGTIVGVPWPASMFSSLGENLETTRVVSAAVVFGVFAVLAGLIRLKLAWLAQHFANRLSHELALETQRRILAQPYTFHIERNSSILASATEKVEILVFDVVQPLMQTVIAGSIATFLLAGLLYMNPVATVIATASFSAIYILVSAMAAKRLAANSTVVGSGYHQRLKIVQESLSGIRDVIVDDAQATHTGLFDQVNSRIARARASSSFLAQAPRYIVESVGMVVIAGIAVLLIRREGGIGLALPFLGALALGGQRVLPLVQTVYTGWSSVAAQRSIFGQVLDLLRLPVAPAAEPSATPFELKRSITVEGVSFAYPDRRNRALNELTLEIPRGKMLALLGPTGSGKSTLLDVVMGLLPPNKGRVLIDGSPLTAANQHHWHRSIAHVPQAIFLTDTSIGQNIGLSLPHVNPDQERIVEAATKAQLHEFIVSLPESYETRVGERGVRLSGGQRQRLGIARAIYKNTPILIFDEPTSALDDLTEEAVIGALEGLRREGRTIIIVAHRISTVRRCDLVARLDRGRVIEFHPLDHNRQVRAKQS